MRRNKVMLNGIKVNLSRSTLCSKSVTKDIIKNTDTKMMWGSDIAPKVFDQTQTTLAPLQFTKATPVKKNTAIVKNSISG